MATEVAKCSFFFALVPFIEDWTTPKTPNPSTKLFFGSVPGFLLKLLARLYCHSALRPVFTLNPKPYPNSDITNRPQRTNDDGYQGIVRAFYPCPKAAYGSCRAQPPEIDILMRHGTLR